MQAHALNNQTGRSLKGIVPTFILLPFFEMGFGEGKEMCKGELIVAKGDTLDVHWQRCSCLTGKD